MAKLSAVNKNNSRIKLSDKLYKKRAALKKIVMDKKITLEERFKAQQKLSKLPRNSAKIRVMNRCEITGRPHGVYRKLKISRIALRQLGLQGKIPGLVKSSW
ncbi:30S ribosomal protein S14 [Candidatus Pelagibacter sp.]|nr:30S ribosomal protein S14 [Candidatus Pelagibacter sp.]